MIAEYKLVDYGEGFTVPHFIDDGGQFYNQVTEKLIGKVLAGVEIPLPAVEITKAELIDRQLAQHLLTPFGQWFKGEFIVDTVEEVTARVNAWCDSVGE